MRLLAMVCVLAGCSGEARRPDNPDLDSLAATVIADVERAVGLPFRAPPRMAWRSREAVTRYLEAKLAEEYPDAALDQVAGAYRLFGFIPDTLDLRRTLIALLSEQVVGFYEPDSSTLYVVEGAVPEMVRLTLGHELVHALQHQYVPLDSLMGRRGQNDEQVAFQAVMEGQATLASLLALLPAAQAEALGDFWSDYRSQVRAAQNQMPQFRDAPLILREGLLFPYLGGADFVRWFDRTYPDTVPFGPRLPVSTEQVLHPERYRQGDTPVRIRFADGPWYEDDLGEFETRLLLTELTGSEVLAEAAATGWDGDRYGVFVAGADTALVWWVVWDDDTARRRFRNRFEAAWRERPAAHGRRYTLADSTIAGQPATRLVDAPAGWAGWERLPGLR